MRTTITHKNRAAALILAFVLATTPLAACGTRHDSSATEATPVSGTANTSTKTDGYAAAESEEFVMYETESGYWGEDIEWNTEEYAAVDEGGFILVSTRPLSTVSADVDTASWCNLRRMVRDGYALTSAEDGGDETEWGSYDYDGIPAGAVRIE
jgi:Ca-activated chloride channel family protein